LLSQTAAAPRLTVIEGVMGLVGFGEMTPAGGGKAIGLAPGTPIDVGRSGRHFTVTYRKRE
jgi:hypothetical protein